MIIKRQGAAVSPTTPRKHLQTQCYNLPGFLSSSIGQLLGSLMFGLQCLHHGSPEQISTLNAIDSLLRLKIDLKQLEGRDYGR